MITGKSRGDLTLSSVRSSFEQGMIAMRERYWQSLSQNELCHLWSPSSLSTALFLPAAPTLTVFVPYPLLPVLCATQYLGNIPPFKMHAMYLKFENECFYASVVTKSQKETIQHQLFKKKKRKKTILLSSPIFFFSPWKWLMFQVVTSPAKAIS